jgi:hypothetical protein
LNGYAMTHQCSVASVLDTPAGFIAV